LPGWRDENLPVVEVEAGQAFGIRFLRLRLNAGQRARRAPPQPSGSAMLNDLERRILKEALRQARNLLSR
jgi:hypothetical protein